MSEQGCSRASNYGVEFPNTTDVNSHPLLKFSLHPSLHVRVNLNFVLNPICRIARGARNEIAELSDIFLHVASRGIAYEGKARACLTRGSCPLLTRNEADGKRRAWRGRERSRSHPQPFRCCRHREDARSTESVPDPSTVIFRRVLHSLKNLPAPNVTCDHVIQWVFLEGTVWKFPLGSGACFFFTAVSGGGEKNVCVIPYALGIS